MQKLEYKLLTGLGAVLMPFVLVAGVGMVLYQQISPTKVEPKKQYTTTTVNGVTAIVDVCPAAEPWCNDPIVKYETDPAILAELNGTSVAFEMNREYCTALKQSYTKDYRHGFVRSGRKDELKFRKECS